METFEKESKYRFLNTPLYSIKVELDDSHLEFTARYNLLTYSLNLNSEKNRKLLENYIELIDFKLQNSSEDNCNDIHIYPATFSALEEINGKIKEEKIKGLFKKIEEFHELVESALGRVRILKKLNEDITISCPLIYTPSFVKKEKVEKEIQEWFEEFKTKYKRYIER